METQVSTMDTVSLTKGAGPLTSSSSCINATAYNHFEVAVGPSAWSDDGFRGRYPTFLSKHPPPYRSYNLLIQNAYL